MEEYDYVIVGSGLAGVSAIKGIRDEDEDGSIMLIGREEELPYDRPPLSKDLLLEEGKEVEGVRIEAEDFYRENEVDVKLGTEVVDLEVDAKHVMDENGDRYGYEHLLLATGGQPKTLDIPGGDLDGVIYYRYLDDYREVDRKLGAAEKAVVIGGGFIGSEMAAALTQNDLEVSMVFPERYLLERIFPVELAGIVQEDYRRRGVKVFNEETPESITKEDGVYRVKTSSGRTIEGDVVIAGIGIAPSVELAERAGLEVFDGIGVDGCLETTVSDVYAAGDVAYFPYAALGDCKRVEHWDNAIKQGKQAGRNMAGAEEAYDYVPYFFSDLFDLGFEALGEIDSRLDTFIDWKNEGETGAIYYLSEEGKVRGVVLLGLWGKKKAARRLIESDETFEGHELKGEIE
ncbi:MAG: NAD(P)/FAD-dependent oxidoreductase [Candidatus Acetothermia bacterium]